MKELSIEEKSKRYDEAIEKAKSKLYYADKPCFVDIKEIFPELKESEDEKIKKEIIHFLEITNSQMTPNQDWDWKNRWLPWLEKQGEQKPIIVTNFNVGDVITDNTGVYPHKKIEAIENENYVVRCLYTNRQQYIPINKQDEYILVEQNPADKVEPNPAWSEEDRKTMRQIFRIVKDSGCSNRCYNRIVKFMNNITQNPKNNWKPGATQMKALNDINLTGSISYAGQGQELITLYNDLKKLK